MRAGLSTQSAVHPHLERVPLSAPWAKVSETIAFTRRVGAARAVPIHDGTLSEAGRSMYLGHVRSYGAEGGLELLDLRGAGATTL